MFRVTQKMMEARCHNMCRYLKIPVYKDRKYNNSKYRTGAIDVGYAYGKMCVEFVYPKSSATSEMSGYLTAPEMYEWLDHDVLKAKYNRLQKSARESLKDSEARAKAKR